MDPRYSSSRYTGTRPRSPTYNPARASLPTSIGYSSMYGGDIHVMPTSSRYASTGSASSRGHHHSHSTTNPTTTTTYAVTKNDPLARGASLRDMSRNHRSSTLDSTAPRPVIVTTTTRTPQTSSSHHSSSNRHSSPTRDDYRSSDTSFYTQPASSIRSRSHHRGGSYSATMDNEEFTRLRERTTDPRHDSYRPTRSSTYANIPRHGNAPIDYGATDGYEYTTPSDLARYDLDHSRPPSRSRRRESIDRGYYRPSVNVTTTDPASRPYNETGRRGGPPPTTRGLDKINRSTPSVYDPNLGSIPPAVPAAPAHMAVPPSPKDRRSAGVPSSLDVAATSVPAGTIAGVSSSRRPVSVYNDGAAPRSSHHEEYYRSREDDRAQRQVREDRKYDPIYGSGDYFHDDAVTARGFGIRTDSAPVGGDFDDRRDPWRDVRSDSRNGYRSDSRAGYRPESRSGHRPESRSGHRTSPPDTKRGSDDESRSKRESARLEPEKDRHVRRTSTANEDDGERKRFRDKVSAGLGLAATAIGLGQAVNEKDDKPERPEKLDRESRRRGDDEEPEVRSGERHKARDESRDPRDRAPVIVETRRSQADPDADVRERDRDRDRERERERERDRERDRDRNRRDAEARLAGDSEPPSQRDGSPDDESRKTKRPARQSIGFNPTNTNDIRELKEQLAAMKEKDEKKEKVPVPVERSDRPERPERLERYEERYDRPERTERSERFDREDRSGGQTYADLPIRDTKDRESSPKKESVPKRESPVSMPSTDSAMVSTRDEPRGRDTTPAHGEEKQVRVVSPPRDKSDAKPLKGILKAPSRFPEEDNPIREGVAPHKDDKKLKEVPPGARWTKISRKIVNPEALTVGKERFEVRDDFVIVLRVLSKEEIQAYAAATQVLRERRREEAGKDRGDRDKERDRERDRDRDRDHDRGRDADDEDRRRHYRHHKRDDGDDDRYDEERDWDRHRRHRRDDDEDEDSRRRDDYHHHRHHRDRDRDQLAIEG